LYTLFLLYSITSSPKNNKIHQFGGLCLQSESNNLKMLAFLIFALCDGMSSFVRLIFV
jgi:hypothetical protein